MCAADSDILESNPITPETHLFMAKKGEWMAIRTICPEDETRVVQFHESLSSESVYRRYFSRKPLSERLDQARLAHTCLATQEDEIVLIAEQKALSANVQKIVSLL